MLIISQEQMDEFDCIARINFHQRLAVFLREEMPDEIEEYDEVALLNHIEESEQRASIYGIETERGIAQWTCLTFLFGIKFDEMPEMREYLETSDVVPYDNEEKIKKLIDSLNALERDENAQLENVIHK